jgi:hypothetical protein
VESLSQSTLKSFTALSALALPRNKTFTYDFLRCCPRLTSLDLTDNNTIRWQALSYLTCLSTTSLNLAENRNISDRSLKFLPCLRSLILDGNKTVTDDGISFMTSLTHLSLSQNLTAWSQNDETNLTVTDKDLLYSLAILLLSISATTATSPTLRFSV